MGQLAGVIFREPSGQVESTPDEMIARLRRPWWKERMPAVWRGRGAGLAIGPAPGPVRPATWHLWVDPEGRLVVLLEGVLDDRAGLARALDRRQDGECPSDVCLAASAFDRWGARAATRLLGDFTAVFWECEPRRLTIINDPFATRPMHLVETRDFFAFASAPRALFALPGIRRTVDRTQFTTLLSNRPLDPSRSMFAGIDRVAGGHVCSWTPAARTSRAYWSMADCKPAATASDGEYFEAFREQLGAVARDRSAGVDPIGMFASGGLDSSAAAWALSQHHSAVQAFCAGPPDGFAEPLPAGRYADERPLLQLVAGALPALEVHAVAVRSSLSMFEDEDDWFASAERPYVGALNRHMVDGLLRAGIDAGMNTMYHSTCGNTVVSWGGRLWSRTADRHAVWSTLREEWRDVRHPVEVVRALWQTAGVVRRRRAHGGGMNKPLSTIVSQGVKSGVPWPVLPPARLISRLEWAALSDQMPYAGHVAQRGVVLRDLMLDRRLVEMCFGLPRRCFVHRYTDRRLVREGLRGRLPEAVLSNRQRGLQVPNWLPILRSSEEAARAVLTQLHDNDVARETLDLPRLGQWLSTVQDAKSDSMVTTRRLLMVLARGLHAGSFLLWCTRQSSIGR